MSNLKCVERFFKIYKYLVCKVQNIKIKPLENFSGVAYPNSY